ncbi:hypothetical protein B566_EDAN004588 [Ephemera danica]|nr:hypothetical protein B566_EDAN004588 [Ephemera danica]
MPAPPGDVLQFSSCMFVTYPGPDNSSSSGRRPVAAVPARPRPGLRSKKAPYRHVPHREKPPQLVARRNARERRRVQAVNAAFVRLRHAVPGDPAASRGKRVSKVKTLQRAIDYICLLQELLTTADQVSTEHQVHGDHVTRWTESNCKRDDEVDFTSLLQDFAPQF